MGSVSNPFRGGLGVEVGDVGRERGGEFGNEGGNGAVTAGAESGETVSTESVAHCRGVQMLSGATSREEPVR